MPSDKIITEEDPRAVALEFAKKIGANQKINDPSGKTRRRESKNYKTYNKTDIETWLKSPTTSEKELRDASIFLYQTNPRYRSLLSYFANLPCWTHTITAVNYNPTKGKKENMKKQYMKTCNIIESMKVEKTMRDATLVALREGVYYGVIWGGDGSNFIMQKLNPDHCTILSVSDGGVFDFAYDMGSLQEDKIDGYFPPEFKDMWDAYVKTGERYQKVPPEISFCLKADPTVPEYSIPPFASVLPALYYIKAVEELSVTSSELQNYKLLAAELPLDENGVPTMTYETAMEYYDHISNNLAEMIGLCITPFKIKDFTFDKSSESSQVNSVSRATENFFAAAGTSAQLHGITNDTSSVTKLAIKVDEAYSFVYVEQCEQIINRFLKLMSGTQKFKIRFLPVTQFNKPE